MACCDFPADVLSRYGHLEQINHCDIYVFYDDVQFSKEVFLTEYS